MAFKMKAGPGGPMKKNFPGAFPLLGGIRQGFRELYAKATGGNKAFIESRKTYQKSKK